MSDSRFPTILPFECSDMMGSEVAIGDHQDLLEAERMVKLQLETRLGHNPPDEIQALKMSTDQSDHDTLVLYHRLARIHAIQNERANMVVPISHIPGDVLRLVFQRYADDSEVARVMGSSLFAISYYVGRSWFILGQVCRRWRCILFDMPTLWANKLFELGYRRLPTLLPLAKGALLDIDLCDRLGQMENTWNEMRPHMDRAWRITNESFMVDQVVPFMELLSSRPLPHLRSIKLTRTCLEGDVPSAPMSDHPNLRSVIMSSVYMRPPLHGGLLSLEIDLSRSDSIKRPNYDELLNVLSHNPRLRRLDLIGVLRVAQKAVERVALPALMSLRLFNEDYLQSASLLDSLRTPSLHIATLNPKYTLFSRNGFLALYRSLLDAWTCGAGTDASSDSLRVERVFPADSVLVRSAYDVELRGLLDEYSQPTKRFSIAEYIKKSADPPRSELIARHTIRWQRGDEQA